jgi:hypothetical protein
MRALFVVLLLAGAQPGESVTAEFRVFAGDEEITATTRLRVTPTGKRDRPRDVEQGPRPSTTLAPGIYDVQVLRLRQESVVAIRWAERLVVMQYPDEAGRHLEVINFETGFGALQVRPARGEISAYDVAVFAAGERTTPAASPVTGDGYTLFVLPAGRYDIRVRHASDPPDADHSHWLLDVEVPADRTRMKQIDVP